MRDRAVHFRNSKGFSLTELLVVIGIAGIILAIATPSIVSQISHLRLTRSVREVVTELNAARFRAIAQNRRYQVNFAPPSYQLQTWNGASYVDEPGRAAGQLGDSISITSPGGAFVTEFYPDGSSTATSICIENTKIANDRMKVTVKGATGMINAETGC